MSKSAIAKPAKAEKPSKKLRRPSGGDEKPLQPAYGAHKEAKKSRQSKDNENAKENAPKARTSVLVQEEKSFPRGGASVLTPIERKQIQIQADRDALFEESGSKKRKPVDVSDSEDEAEVAAQEKPKKKRRTRDDGKRAQAEPVEKIERIEPLTFRKLVPGSIVLGQVSQITSRDIALTLPNNLIGFVPLTSISRQLTSRVEKLLEEAEKEDADGASEEDNVFEDVDLKKMFNVGQYLRASVVSNDDMQGGKRKKHLELSLDPRVTNAGLAIDDLVNKATVQAAVVSVEDNGLVVDLGIEGSDAKGFISSNEVGAGLKHSDIEEGTVLLCMVTGQTGNGRVIKLTSDTAKIGDLKKGHSLTNAPSIKTFMPGTSATVIVSEITPLGLKGSIMGMLEVTADLVHAGGVQGKADLEKKYKPGSKVDTRVLHSCPSDSSPKIGVSLVEHVLSLSPKCLTNKKGQSPLEQQPMSSIIPGAKVIKVEPRRGIYLDIGIPRVHAFSHISQLADKQVESLAEDIGPFKVGSVHKARITGYSAMDGLYQVTLKESVLAQPFLRLEDVKPGEIVEGTVEDMPIKPDGIAGMRLLLAEEIRGFVPADHISDIKLKHPERKYRVGMAVKARVLSVNAEKRTIYLTMKKTLVASEETPWTDWQALKIGDQAPGTITKLTPHGAWVQFYADVRAFLPVREMSEAYIEDPKEHFHVGQVVNVHILSVDAEAKRMLVSCKTSNASSAESKEKFDAIKVGQLVSGSIVELGNEFVSLELEGGVQGHLKVAHLTDGSEKKCASALSKLRAGQTLKDLLVLQKIEKSRTIRLSNKPSLVKAAGEGKLLTEMRQVKKGKAVHGFVSSITVSGIFVEFGDNFTGLMPIAGMTDEMRAKKMQDFGLRKDQSVEAKVLAVYPEENKFTLTLRDDDIPAEVRDPAEQASRKLKNPVDNKLKSLDDLTIGTQTLARVNARKDMQLNVSLADGVHGRIHATELFNSFDEIVDPKKPLKSFKHQSTLRVTVTGLHAAKTTKFLPLSHRGSAHPVFECSHKQANTSEPVILSLLKLKLGEERLAFVTQYNAGFAVAALSPEVSGTIDISELSAVDADYAKEFPIGCAIPVRIEKLDVEKSKLQFSLVRSVVTSRMKSDTGKGFDVGKTYVGHVRKSHPDGLDVHLSKTVWGLVPLTELADDFEQARPESWKAKDVIKVAVIDGRKDGKDNGRLILSARPSVVSPTELKGKIQDQRIAGKSDLKVGKAVRGFVQNVGKQGVIVRLGWNTTAQVPVHELADEFLKNFESKFKPRQLVKGKISKVDSQGSQHKMSLRASVLENPKYKGEINFTDLNIGDLVDAVVVKVEKYGVFITVEGSKNVRGLCHAGQLANARVEDPSKLYSEGDKVKAKIIKLDATLRHINFSLKAVHFQGEDESEEEPSGGVDVTNKAEAEDDDQEIGGVDLQNVREMDSEDQAVASESDEEMKDAPAPPAKKKRSSSGGLKTAGFDWNASTVAADNEAAQSEAEVELPKKKRKKAEIQVDRTGDLDALGPQSVSDFERLLLGQPNSSALWIQYMAFQLGLNEVDKAREIAERALRTIHMREEDQKMNVWVALLNLENTYGSEETLEAVFERACQMSDKKVVHMRLVSIYIDSGKHKEAEELLTSMRKIRECATDPTFWLNHATFLMTTLNRPDDARAILARATQSLPSHTHAQTISRFGALEYASPNGDVERGRTIFEGLVDAHKNGHDLWDQYVAQEMSLQAAGRGGVENVRGLFERMAALKMKPKRAKFVFKKWLTWEKQMNERGKATGKDLAKVKALAEDYVENNKMKGGMDV